jgi:hypothetical protein
MHQPISLVEIAGSPCAHLDPARPAAPTVSYGRSLGNRIDLPALGTHLDSCLAGPTAGPQATFPRCRPGENTLEVLGERTTLWRGDIELVLQNGVAGEGPAGAP